jgi:hypothetical protein
VPAIVIRIVAGPIKVDVYCVSVEMACVCVETESNGLQQALNNRVLLEAMRRVVKNRSYSAIEYCRSVVLSAVNGDPQSSVLSSSKTVSSMRKVTSKCLYSGFQAYRNKGRTSTRLYWKATLLQLI